MEWALFENKREPPLDELQLEYLGDSTKWMRLDVLETLFMML